MRKSEMTVQQLEERQLIIDKLTSAKWQDLSVGDWFEQNLWAKFEATMGFKNNGVSLEIDFNSEQQYIRFIIQNLLSEFIMLIIYYQDKLEKLLETIVSFQDKITESTFEQYVREILRVCPTTTYASIDDDTDAQLVDEDDY